MSVERQQAILERQIEENPGRDRTGQGAEGGTLHGQADGAYRKSLETRLAKLNDQSRKDDVVTFEQLGIDRLFIDESHYFKNLFLATKMRKRGRHCPDRSPEIQRSVYENAVSGRADGRARHNFCYWHPHFQLHGSAPVRGCNNLTLSK